MGYGASQNSYNSTSACKLYLIGVSPLFSLPIFCFTLEREEDTLHSSVSVWGPRFSIRCEIVRQLAPFAVSPRYVNCRHEDVDCCTCADHGRRCLLELVVGVSLHVVESCRCRQLKAHCCGLSCKGTKSLQAVGKACVRE